MGNQYTAPDSTAVNITHINNTEADLATNLLTCQIGIANNTDALVYKDMDGNVHRVVPGRLSDGTAAAETKYIQVSTSGTKISDLSTGLVYNTSGILSTASSSQIQATHSHSSLKASDDDPDPCLSADVSGKIGILTTSPQEYLDVAKSQDARTAVQVYNSNTGADARAALILKQSNPSVASASFVITKYSSTASTTTTDAGNPLSKATTLGVGGESCDFIFNPLSGDMIFEGYDGTHKENMRLKPTGTLMLGTTSNAGKLIAGGTIIATDNVTGSLFADPSNESYGSGYLDADDGTTNINYNSYNGGTDYYRDLAVYDGKGNQTALFDASSGNYGVGTYPNDPAARLHISKSTTCSMYIDNSATASESETIGKISFRANDSSTTMTENAFISARGNVNNNDSAGYISIGIHDGADDSSDTMLEISAAGYGSTSAVMKFGTKNDYDWFTDNTGDSQFDAAFHFVRDSKDIGVQKASENQGFGYNVGATSATVSKIVGKTGLYANQTFEDGLLFSTSGASVDIISLPTNYGTQFHGDIQMVIDRGACLPFLAHAAFRLNGSTVELYSTTGSLIDTDAYSAGDGKLHMIWDDGNKKLTLQMADDTDGSSTYAFPVAVQYRLSLLSIGLSL